MSSGSAIPSPHRSSVSSPSRAPSTGGGGSLWNLDLLSNIDENVDDSAVARGGPVLAGGDRTRAPRTARPHDRRRWRPSGPRAPGPPHDPHCSGRGAPARPRRASRCRARPAPAGPVGPHPAVHRRRSTSDHEDCPRAPERCPVGDRPGAGTERPAFVTAGCMTPGPRASPACWFWASRAR